MTERDTMQPWDEDRAFAESVLIAEGAISKENGGFCPNQHCRPISEKLGIAEDDVMKILLSPNPRVYEECEDVLARIFQAGSAVMLWTQGELTHDLSDEARECQEIGFQEIKAQRSGLMEMLAPFQARLEQLGLPLVTGGFKKTTENVLDPIAQIARSQYRSILVVDDRVENLIEAAEYFSSQGIVPQLHLIDRSEEPEEMIPGIRTISSLTELPIQEETLYLLDLDRTAIGTDTMKEDWLERFLLQSMLHANQTGRLFHYR